MAYRIQPKQYFARFSLEMALYTILAHIYFRGFGGTVYITILKTCELLKLFNYQVETNKN